MMVYSSVVLNKASNLASIMMYNLSLELSESKNQRMVYYLP
jgi:hypothetical protein